MGANVVSGTFTSTTSSNTFTPQSNQTTWTKFNISMWGTYVATMVLERTFDGGTTWLPCTAGGVQVNFSNPCTEVIEEPEPGILYRMRCSAFTSGTVNYRISQ
jgi:hypothetical protein